MSIRTTFIFMILVVWNINQPAAQPSFTLDNPVTEQWLRRNIKATSPRLLLTGENEKQLKNKIAKDPAVGAVYRIIKANADEIIGRPALTYEKVGRRLLGVSREALRRISLLGLVYRLERERQYLQRLEKEISAVCAFPDWNPSHFLDVGEMALAVAIGLDWAGEDMRSETIALAKDALKTKGLEPGLPEKNNWWISTDNNWNQVCHGGLAAAAIVLANDEPAIAARILSRALDKIPLGLEAYDPDGAYPEGPSYWSYGTGFTLATIAVFESAFKTDFGISQAPGFMESADYRLLVTGPTGQYFNYADAGDGGKIDLNTMGLLAWFAQKTGDGLYLDKEKLKKEAEQVLAEGRSISRLGVFMLVWTSEFDQTSKSALPRYWIGQGINPIAIMRSPEKVDSDFYLACKGGAGSVNHGNMDAGSFIFELNGVRWSVDPGNQGYHQLEEIMGGGLWDSRQEGQRWTLLTKSNFGHSTLTVNNSLHRVDGFASIRKDDSDRHNRRISIDLGQVLGDQVESASRTFDQVDNRILRITDEIVLSPKTDLITWSMITQADVLAIGKSVVLQKGEEQLSLKIVSPRDVGVTVISLDPPPLEYDKHIEGLKRIEIRCPAYIFDSSEAHIAVELEGIE